MKLRYLTFVKYLRLPIGWFDKEENSPGSLLTKLSSDTTQLNGIALSMIGIICQTVVTLAAGLGLGFYYDWRLSLINIGCMPFIVGANILSWNMRVKSMTADEHTESSAGSILSESVCNTKTIYAYNMQNKVVKLYSNILDKSLVNMKMISFITGISFGCSQLFVFGTYAAVFYAGGRFMVNLTLTPGDLLRAMFSIIFAAVGVSAAQQYVGDVSAANKALINLFNIIDEPSDIDPLKDEENNNTNQKPIEHGKIEFRDVNFSYPTRPNNKIFKGLNFTINPGQKAGFVGYSGSGKSSVIQLIERFYNYESGQILIDGQEIKDYKLINYKKQIALVSQEPDLFKRSVLENIRYGKLDATDNEVQEVAIKANIAHKLNLENNDIPVSGGEKQRIAIARAILKNPKILLLDEATSALDENNENIVQETINSLMVNRTCIVIAHR